jgi:hypothetical protein
MSTIRGALQSRVKFGSRLTICQMVPIVFPPASNSSMRTAVGPGCACANGQGQKPRRALTRIKRYKQDKAAARVSTRAQEEEPFHWPRLVDYCGRKRPEVISDA